MRTVESDGVGGRAHQRHLLLGPLPALAPTPGGEKRARLAVAHSLLTVIWHRLKDGTAYREWGADDFDRIEPRRLERPAVARLERWGFVVTLQKKTA